MKQMTLEEIRDTLMEYSGDQAAVSLDYMLSTGTQNDVTVIIQRLSSLILHSQTNPENGELFYN